MLKYGTILGLIQTVPTVTYIIYLLWNKKLLYVHLFVFFFSTITSPGFDGLHYLLILLLSETTSWNEARHCVISFLKDRLLAELLIKVKDWIVTYHEHDSLLQNQTEEDLTEEERQAAWNEYENEREGKEPETGPEFSKHTFELPLILYALHWK